MTDSTPIFELRGVSFGYPGRANILNELDFALPRGARVGIIGPNGAGKTTMAHILMGLVKPTSGRILFRGKAVESEDGFVALRKAVGLLFQNAEDQLIFPTVIEDVAFGPLNAGKSASEAKDIALRTLASLGLSGFEHRVTHKLSGGEKKLVSLASVLAMDPEALFLDEPTNALDVDTRERLVSILNGLDKALIIISHDWDFLARTTHDIYAMRNGRVTFDGETHAHQHIHAHVHGTTPHTHGE
ncbi:cobalt/nickel transport system ATP-binding protein [Desulfobaculum xiamenense]|uniref:Cobalt/nickel transport system ATP-binding protein n=1 Tax=Desulfobaculum xiamenense TaxID=995050 RepID=A0A846QFV9_9BACT|nr:ABC transporter ATP-binding protein [Desulfobaculum xiamenense]NJB67121.1 cobalt/nickel transport system ATP-binding protein [Desulfobaculum xiamenense]